METIITPEPEEHVENALVALLAKSVKDIPVEGTHDPAPAGETKYGQDTFINVSVGQTEQLVDVQGRSPYAFAARINVHVARKDDKTGRIFRDTCRAIRAALTGLTGKGCVGLDGDHFSAGEFTIDSTAAGFSGAIEGGEYIKTYTATVVGRIH